MVEAQYDTETNRAEVFGTILTFRADIELYPFISDELCLIVDLEAGQCKTRINGLWDLAVRLRVRRKFHLGRKPKYIESQYGGLHQMLLNNEV